jgi:hypothetical protein
VNILKFSDYFSERNVKISLIIISIVTFVLYLTTFQLFSGIFLFADIQFIIGGAIGVIYALRNRSPDQSILKCGVIVGIFGGVISAFIISLWQTVFNFWSIIEFFIFFGYTLITGVLIGLIIGALVGSIYMYGEMKGETYEEEQKIDEDFYKDLIDEK